MSDSEELDSWIPPYSLLELAIINHFLVIVIIKCIGLEVLFIAIAHLQFSNSCFNCLFLIKNLKDDPDLKGHGLPIDPSEENFFGALTDGIILWYGDFHVLFSVIIYTLVYLPTFPIDNMPILFAVKWLTCRRRTLLMKEPSTKRKVQIELFKFTGIRYVEGHCTWNIITILLICILKCVFVVLIQCKAKIIRN